jgi:hypothetical protein
MCAGHSMLCPYTERTGTHCLLARFARGASAIEERFLAAFRARTKRGKGRTARNSAPFLRQGRQDDGARESEADGEQVAKHLRRAQHAVPLRKDKPSITGSTLGHYGSDIAPGSREDER